MYPDLSSPEPFLQKVHSDCLLVSLCEDSLAVPLDHAGFTNRAIANYHHLQIAKKRKL